MTPQTFYRADKRDFYPGDVIRSAGDFPSKNPQGSQEVEATFENARPAGKPRREGCLYLFEDIAAARKHWSKMTGGKLYEVTLIEGHVLHRADMAVVDEAFRNRSNPAEIARCSELYWSGILSPMSVVEVLVSSAVVTVIISKNEDERRAHFRSWAITTS